MDILKSLGWRTTWDRRYHTDGPNRIWHKRSKQLRGATDPTSLPAPMLRMPVVACASHTRMPWHSPMTVQKRPTAAWLHGNVYMALHCSSACRVHTHDHGLDTMTYACACMRTRVSAHMCVSIHMHVNTHVHTHIHTHVHTHVYSYVHEKGNPERTAPGCTLVSATSESTASLQLETQATLYHPPSFSNIT